MPYIPTRYFCLIAALVTIAIAFASRLATNDYFFFAGYAVLQYVVMATAWNILGGYTGYVNFGTAGFFAIGAYSAVVMHKLFEPPLIASIVVGGFMAGLVGLGRNGLANRRDRNIAAELGSRAIRFRDGLGFGGSVLRRNGLCVSESSRRQHNRK